MHISSNGEYQNARRADGFFIKTFETEDELREIVKKDWTPAVVDNTRTINRFSFSQFLFADIDNDSEDTSKHCSIDDFSNIFKNKDYWIITSRNHQKDKNKKTYISKATDRFHVLFTLSEDCDDPKWLKEEEEKLVKQYPFFDSNVKDVTRFFFGVENPIVIHHEGAMTKYTPNKIEEVKVSDYSDNGKQYDDLKPRVLSLLKSCNLDNRQDWITVGMAMKAEGFSLDDWASVSWPSVPRADLEYRWNNFNSSKLTMGTLVAYARKADPTFLTKGSLALRGNIRGTSAVSNPQATQSKVTPINYLDFFRQEIPVKNFPNYKLIPKKQDVAGTIQTVFIPKVQNTLWNLEFLLEHYHIETRYNLMSHKSELLVPGIDGEGNVENASLGQVKALCLLNELNLTTHLNDLVETIAFRYKVHPVKAWILEDNEQWDGVDRFSQLMSCVKRKETFPEYNLNLYFRKWLISAIASLFEETYRGRGVLMFIGGQNQGKTTLMKTLMKKGCEGKWYAEGVRLNTSNKDSLAIAISHWVCEMGEIAQTWKSSDIESLKGFLTGQYDVVRFPYLRREETYQRRSVYVASSNDPIVLRDDTGDTRFWTVEVEHIYLQGLKNLNAKQLWLQVKTWYDAGEQWWLNDFENQLLEETNKQFKEVNEFEDLIQTFYRVDMKNLDRNNRLLTITEILMECQYKNINRTTLNKMAKYLKSSGFVSKKTAHKTGYLMPDVKNQTQKENDQYILEREEYEGEPL